MLLHHCLPPAGQPAAGPDAAQHLPTSMHFNRHTAKLLAQVSQLTVAVHSAQRQISLNSARSSVTAVVNTSAAEDCKHKAPSDMA